jgi:hypothetical protein
MVGEAVLKVVRGSFFQRQDLKKDLKMVNWMCLQIAGEDSK